MNMRKGGAGQSTLGGSAIRVSSAPPAIHSVYTLYAIHNAFHNALYPIHYTALHAVHHTKYPIYYASHAIYYAVCMACITM